LAGKVGGIGTFARLLGCNRMTLQLLMRIPGRIPRAKIMQKLAEVSGESIGFVRSVFGIRTNPRTAAVIAAVRERFPRDRGRLAVVKRIENEHWTVSDYARAAGIGGETLRRWLRGERAYPAKRSLLRIAQYEDLTQRDVGIPRYTREAVLRKILAGARKKLLRRKHLHRSDHMRQALSQSVKNRWASPSWRQAKGNKILLAWQAGHPRRRTDEDSYLKYLVRLWAAHFRRFHRSAKPKSSLTLQELPAKVQTILGVPLHAHIRVNGRPYDVQEIATLIQLFAETPHPKRFWEEASQRLYNDRDRAEVTRERWTYLRKQIPLGLLHRLAEVILGTPINLDRFQDMIRLVPGRPTRTPPLPV
jgi:transcriptional regulator with XRE-family HTH domain